MISDNIRNYRKANNLSQDELAEKLGVSRQSISLWENGQTQPTLDNIIALAKIFHVTSDALLSSESSETVSEPAESASAAPVGEEQPPKKKKPWLIPVIAAAAAVLLLGAALFAVLHNRQQASMPEEESGDSSDAPQHSGESEAPVSSAEVTSGDTDSMESIAETSAPQQSGKTGGTATTAKEEPTNTAQPQAFDLFAYCKNFAIQKGQLNGDYTIYQQPATRYGGYENEYFSISYWGGSDMVEFCLHCPLSETLSINFYLRMRGGYNKSYEYVSSKYYRDNGAPLRNAAGTIDPTVFSDQYPLNCSQYDGAADGQTEFMEESRVGMCDLIRCLKQFVAAEHMECDFSAFDFVNF